MSFPVCNLRKFSRVFQSFVRTLSSNPANTPDTKLYELRQYSIKPDSLSKLIELSKERFHLRLSHSKLVGYFTIELGDLSRVLHLWEYDSFEHRKRVREELSKDAAWISQYVTPAFPLISSQTNAVLRRITGRERAPEQTDGSSSVYAFQTRILKPGRGTQVFNRLESSNLSEIFPSSMIGIWRGVFGPTPSLYSLHRFSSFDAVEQSTLEALKNKEILDTEMFLDSHSTSVSNLGLHPTVWSPLK